MSAGSHFGERFLQVAEYDERGKKSKRFEVQGAKDLFGFDKPLFFVVLCLSLLGILFIYSASK